MDILRLRVSHRKYVATDAILVHLEEVNNQPINYEAGQFLTFLIDRYGKEFRRSYSITTTPGLDEHIAVIIKRHANGEISRYLIDHLQVGDIITSLPPAGRFTLAIEPSGNRTLFFIAAGSGISPIFSLLKKALHFERLSKVILIYQNRDEASIIFRKELQAYVDNFPGRFTMISLLSNPAQIAQSRRLNNSLLEELIAAHTRYHGTDAFYICGPYSFMRMAQFVVRLMGFSEDQIRKENFAIDALPPPPFFSDTSTKNVRLRWKSQVFEFPVSYPMNILQAALNQHIPLPYSCRGGRCSTCTIKCVSGKVKMSVNEVLTEKDLQQGFILTCVGYAETDLELEL